MTCEPCGDDDQHRPECGHSALASQLLMARSLCADIHADRKVRIGRIAALERENEELRAEKGQLRGLLIWREGQIWRAIQALKHGNDCRCVVCVELWEAVPTHLHSEMFAQPATPPQAQQ
jgi:hypothetical protein